MVDLRNPDAVISEISHILNDFRLRDKKAKINKLIDMYWDRLDEDADEFNDLMARINQEREEKQ